MIRKILRPSKNGVSDWLIQRVSSVILALYTVFLLGIFIFKKVDHTVWKQVFSCWAVQLFTLFALMSLLFHAWVGIWTVLTDYVRCAYLRVSLELLLIFALFFYLVWGLLILGRMVS